MAYKMLKEYTLAMDDFNMALSLDKDNDEAKQGLSQIRMSIYSAQKDETVTQNAMKDPNVKVCSRAAFQTFSQRSARVVSFLSVACRPFSPTPTSITCSRICRQIPRQHSAPCPTRA